MGLLGFQNRPILGSEIVDFWGPHGFKPLQNPFKMVGREAPHHFEWFLDPFGAV